MLEAPQIERRVHRQAYRTEALQLRGVGMVMLFMGIFLGLKRCQAISFKQPHAQQQAQRNITTAGPQNSCVGFDRPQLGLNLLQPLLIH